MRLAKGSLKFSLLTLLVIYSASYFYDEVTIGGLPTGGWVFFNLPLGFGQLLFAIYVLKRSTKWWKAIPIAGIIIAVLILIPPYLLKQLVNY